jgi:hypothetical protein
MVVFYLGLELVSREELDGGGIGRAGRGRDRGCWWSGRGCGRRARLGRAKLQRGNAASAWFRRAQAKERERAWGVRASSGRERGGRCSTFIERGEEREREGRRCWELVLKCFELRTRQHKMLNVNALRPLKHYLPKGIMIFGLRS